MTLIVGALLAAPLGGLVALTLSVTGDTYFVPNLTVDNGTATVSRAGRSHQAETGMVLIPGDRIDTGSDGLATLRFLDGSRARMGPDTSVIVGHSFFNTRGELSAALTQLSGRTLETVVGSPGRWFELDTEAGPLATARAVFEVDVPRHGLATIRVFEGAVSAPKATIKARQQQFYDAIEGIARPLETIEEEPSDPFVQTVLAEAAARQLSPAGVLIDTGTVLAAGAGEPAEKVITFPTGGGDLVAILNDSTANLALKITAPDDAVHTAEGPPPVPLQIRGGPPGRYLADVSASGSRVVGPYAVALVLAKDCRPALRGGYVKQLVTAADVVRSVRVSGLWVRAFKFTPRGDEAIFEADGSYRGLPVAVRGLLYAAPPSVRVLLLSVKVLGLPVPAASVGTVNGSELTLLNTGYRVDRVYACNDGVIIEGQPQ